MCYQVVERYAICHCLYYKHAIDSCSAHGQEGHVVREKTVFVGGACAVHGSTRYGSSEGTELMGETFPTELGHLVTTRRRAYSVSSSEDSDDEKSIFSSAVVSYSAGSLTTVDEEDAIDEILRVLINDPLLSWEKLIQPSHSYRHRSELKDIRFFLTTFESDLRITANSPLEFHACTFLRNRIRYLSSQIRERFHILQLQLPDRDVKDESHDTKPSDTLPPITPEDDITFVPSFDTIRHFLFHGVPYVALKENIRNYTRNTRDYREEMKVILAKNIPITDASAMKNSISRDKLGDFYGILGVFLVDLTLEAVNSVSSSDICGLENLRSSIMELGDHLKTFWTLGKPTWYYHDLIPGAGGGLKPGALDPGLESQPEYENFQAFVCSSKAFCVLRSAFREYCKRGMRPRFFSMDYLMIIGLLAKLYPPALGTRRIIFKCSCEKLIYDDYTEAQAGGVTFWQQELRMNAIRQIYYRKATSTAKRGGFGQQLKSFFNSLWSNIMTGPKQMLPQHRNQKSVTQSEKSVCQGHSFTDDTGHMYIHYCIPYAGYAARMLPLRSCTYRSDLEFFTALRDHYHGIQNRFRKALSFKRPVAVRFVKFMLYHHQLVDIQKRDDIPPESRRNEYDYFPMPADTVPPIGPNLLMHFFNHPEDAPPSRIVLSCIPKRKRDKLEPCPIRGSSLGWGIDVATGPNELKLFVCGLIACLCSLTFGVIWTVRQKDIQGGFGVAGFMFATLGFAIASLKALDL